MQMQYERTFQLYHPEFGDIIIARYRAANGNIVFRASVPSQTQPGVVYSVRLDFSSVRRLLAFGCTCPSHRHQRFKRSSPYAACKHVRAVLDLLSRANGMLATWLAQLPRNPAYRTDPGDTRS